MQKLNDLSRSLTTLEPNGTLIAVIEMSLSSWLVAGTLLLTHRASSCRLTHLVRFTPDSDGWADIPGRQLRTSTGLVHGSESHIYSVTRCSGTISTNSVPSTSPRWLMAAPNCFESAAMIRIPNPRLLLGSKPAGNPTPSSRTDMRAVFSSCRTRRTQMCPSERLQMRI